MSSKSIVASLILISALLVFDSEIASGQCAMCRTALEQNGGEVAAGFNRGILFLLGMPYLIFGAIGASWFWKRRRLRNQEVYP